MIKVLFKRLFYKWYTVAFILALVMVAGLSYYFSYGEKLLYAEAMKAGGADLNLYAMQSLLDEYSNGITWFAKFLFSEDFYFIFVILLVLFIGLFIAPEMLGKKTVDMACSPFCGRVIENTQEAIISRRYYMS